MPLFLVTRLELELLLELELELLLELELELLLLLELWDCGPLYCIMVSFPDSLRMDWPVTRTP
tara:strand:+ start:2079 stop:2267 length:189 start_codon:yes stop_codon:yes gene_type:complete